MVLVAAPQDPESGGLRRLAMREDIWAQAALVVGWPPAPCPQHMQRLPRRGSLAYTCQSNERSSAVPAPPSAATGGPSCPAPPHVWLEGPPGDPRVSIPPQKRGGRGAPGRKSFAVLGRWEALVHPSPPARQPAAPVSGAPLLSHVGMTGTLTENPDPHFLSCLLCAGDVLFQMAEVHRQIQNQLEETVSPSPNVPGAEWCPWPDTQSCCPAPPRAAWLPCPCRVISSGIRWLLFPWSYPPACPRSGTLPPSPPYCVLPRCTLDKVARF